MARRSRIGCLGGLVLVAALLALSTPAPVKAQSTPIVLKGTTAWIADYAWSQPFFIFQRLVNQHEKLKGKLVITYLGGPEVVPPFEQFEALRNRVVDVIVGVGAYYSGTIPEGNALLLARKSPMELRKNGYYDLVRKIHKEKGNVVYLANVGGTPGRGFRLYSKVKIDKPDFKGLRFRVTPVYKPLVEALGGTPVTMAPGEVYTALERGVVDAYGWGYLGVKDVGWHEVTKYVIDHPFYSFDTSIMINMDTWNSLPENIRAALEEVAVKVEEEVAKYMADRGAKEDENLKNAGLQFIRFSEADAKKFIELAYEVQWKAILPKCPETCPKLRDLSN